MGTQPAKRTRQSLMGLVSTDEHGIGGAVIVAQLDRTEVTAKLDVDFVAVCFRRRYWFPTRRITPYLMPLSAVLNALMAISVSGIPN